MIPIYTAYLTPEEYATAELLDLTSTIIGLVLGMGITAATLRFYSEHHEESARNAVVSTGLLPSGAAMLTAVLLLTAFSKEISLLVFKTPDCHP